MDWKPISTAPTDRPIEIAKFPIERSKRLTMLFMVEVSKCYPEMTHWRDAPSIEFGKISVTRSGGAVRVKLKIDDLESEHVFSLDKPSGKAWMLWAERNMVVVETE
jgi:hypothetical protein